MDSAVHQLFLDREDWVFIQTGLLTLGLHCIL